MKTPEEYRKTWETANEDNARELIITGHKVKGFGPTNGLEHIPSTVGTLLDFGCGVGRNLAALAVSGRQVWGYDLPNMIKLAHRDPDILSSPHIWVSDNWDTVKGRRFDAIFCCLVLQHMHPEEIASKLADFAGMTDTIYLQTRAYIDHDGGLIKDAIAPHWRIAKGYGISLEGIEAARGDVHYQCRLERVGGKG